MHTPRRTTSAVLAAVALLALAGCSQSMPKDFMDALGRDPATVCFTATSVWGTAKLYRSATGNAAASCNENSLSVTPAPKP